jgi:hypothetical protein
VEISPFGPLGTQRRGIFLCRDGRESPRERFGDGDEILSPTPQRLYPRICIKITFKYVMFIVVT